MGSDGVAARPPWTALETLRPLTLRACRRIVVVAPHPRDEIRAAGGLLHRLAARHADVDVLSLTDLPTRTCTRSDPRTGERAVALGGDGSRVPRVDGVGGELVRDDAGGSGDAEVGALVGLDELDRIVLPPDDGPDPGGAGADEGATGPGAEHGADDHLAADAYRALGLSSVRRHRLGLPDGGVAADEGDVIGAISEIVGFAAEEPSGLCVLAPWSGDGDDDHEAAGRAAEVVTAAYRVRLVRWLDRAWTWAGPESVEVPWRRARQVALSESALARKLAAGAAFGDLPGHDVVLPDGSAPGPREVFLV